jgi:hypothetical protein
MSRIGLRLDNEKLLKSLDKNKLEYFRKLILDHLSKMEKEDKTVSKSLTTMENMMVKGGYAVGTIRTWKGKRYVKIAPGDWRRKYDSQTRGAKMAISAIKKKITAAKNEHEMMQIVLANRDRFSDNKGNPLPFVQEFSKWVDEVKTAKQAVAGKKKLAKKQKAKEKPKEQAKPKKDNVSQVYEKYDLDQNIPLSSHVALMEDSLKNLKEELSEGGYTYNHNKKDKGGVRFYAFKNEEIAQIKERVKYYENAIKDIRQEIKQSGGDIQESGKPMTLEERVHMTNPGMSVEEKYKELKEKQRKADLYGDKDTYNEITSLLHTYFNEAEREKQRKEEFAKQKKEPEKKQEEYKKLVIERLMNEGFDTLEKYVNKEMNRYEFRQYLKEHRYTVEQINDIENFAAILKHNPAIGKPVKLVYDNGEVIPEGAAEIKKQKSDFAKIQNKYKSAKAIEGDDDEIQVGKETLPGKWKLVEADTPTASHDETTFHKTPGFPANADGSTINDRDYGHDKAAQDAVHSIGADFDGRALKVDSPVIITNDGIVISGNNRTMSSKIAAKKGTDGKYIEALKKRAKKFGFTDEQVSGFKNPRVVFEVKQEGAYSTEQFSRFNESGKKEMGPTEKAVKVSKLIKTETVKDIAEKISEFDTLGELYADRSAVQHIFNSFKNAGLIGENEAGKYIEEGSITEDGKTFIETALLGSVMSEANIRGFNRLGCKSIRGMLVRAITPLIENKGMSGYSINRELNEAVDIAMQVAINKDKFKNVDEFAKQQSMFEKFDPVAVELAKRMEGTQKAFAEFMQSINGSLKYAANGEADIFLGGVESKDDIISRFLDIKKAVWEVLKSIPKADIVKSLRSLEG